MKPNDSNNQYWRYRPYSQQPPFSPGPFQQPPPAFPPTSPGRQTPPRAYKGWVLSLFLVCYVIAILFFCADLVVFGSVAASSSAVTSSTASTFSSSAAPNILLLFSMILFLALSIALLVYDGRNFLTLFGKVRWKRLKVWQRLLLAWVYLGLAIMSAFYLFFALSVYKHARQQSLLKVMGGWYRAKPGSTQLVLGIASLLLILLFVSFTAYGMNYDRTQLLLALTPTATIQQQAQVNAPTATTTSSKKPGATATVALPTKSPTRVPSPSPTSKLSPTPRPTQKPTQPPATLFITFTCASAVDYSYGRVCVHTLPGAALTITITYCSGYDATSDSLQGTFYANSAGNYSWSWTPETKCRGLATASVDASWNGQQVSNQDTFDVQ